MRRAYEIRLYPSKTQIRALIKQLALHRALYNAAIEERREAWRMSHTSVYYKGQAAQLKEIRRLDPEYASLNHTAAARTLKRVQRAFNDFYRRCSRGETPGYPRFKGKDRFNSIDYTYGNGVKLLEQERGNPKLYLQNVGEMRIRGWRELPEDTTIKEVTIRERGGRFYAYLKWEAPDVVPPEHTGSAVGVDVGLTTLAALTDDLLADGKLIRAKEGGALVINKRFFRRAEEELAKAQRVRSRRKHGSKRRHKAAVIAARKAEHVARQRRDLYHKLARLLVEAYSVICVEDLDIPEMARRATPEEKEQGKEKYSKSTYDAAWGLFLTLLESKAAEAGSRVIRVDPRNTSQACSSCGTLPLERKTLKVRVHECDCGLVIDRDLNAARNILARGMLLLQLEGGPEGAGGFDPRRLPVLAVA